MKNIKLKISFILGVIVFAEFAVVLAFKQKLGLFDKVFLASVFPAIFTYVYVILTKLESNFKKKNGIKTNNGSTFQKTSL